MGKLPLRPAPDDLEDATVRDYYCEDHRVVMVIDKLGRAVCPVCLVVEALNLEPGWHENADQFAHYATLIEEGVDPAEAQRLMREVYG